jgi:hypothetical protein
MKPILITLLLVFASFASHATSTYDGPVLSKQVGTSYCKLYPDGIRIIKSNIKTMKAPYSLVADEGLMSSDKIYFLIQDAAKQDLEQTGKHIMATDPAIYITASTAESTSAFYVLKADESVIFTRSGNEAAQLIELIERNCKSL